MVSNAVNIEFRAGTIKDDEWIFDLFKRTMQHYVESAWGWDELLQKESFKTSLPIKQFELLCIDDEAVGGYHISEKEDHLLLNMILLEPDFQRQGLGGEMLARIKSQAKKLNKTVWQSVLKTNPAVDFHLKAGFKEVKSDKHSIKMIWVV